MARMLTSSATTLSLRLLNPSSSSGPSLSSSAFRASNYNPLRLHGHDGPSSLSLHGAPRVWTPSSVRAMASSSSDSDLEQAINKTISENPVVVYSKTWCSYSAEVKFLFKKLGVEHFVVELDKSDSQGDQLQQALEQLTGQHTVPNVFIGGKHIGGCTDTFKLYQSGELEQLLAKANAKKVKG